MNTNVILPQKTVKHNESVHTERMKKSALLYAEQLGFQVFPLHSIKDSICTCGKLNCSNPGKHPIELTSYSDATTDLEIIEKLWTKHPMANIGVRCGRGSGIFALDVDNRKVDGMETLRDLEANFGLLPNTVQTTSSLSGAQYLFKYEDGVRNMGEFAPGLVVRGDSSYIVVAPSIHISGESYEWNPTHHPNTTPIVEAPSWLLEMILPSESKKDNKRTKTKTNDASDSSIYFDEKGKFVPPWLGDAIIKEFPLFFDGKHLYFYKDGIYKRDEGKIISKIIHDKMGDRVRRNRYAEVIFYLQTKRWITMDKVNADETIINLKNGLLDWKTCELKPHTSEILSTIQIPLVYNPEAQSPNIDKFFSEIVSTDTIPLLHEWFGYSLIPSTRHEKAMMLNGNGANGKSKLIELYQFFIGHENISNVSLQDLEGSRFKPAQLIGKLANVHADLPSEDLKGTSVFKTTVSGDWISVEFKGIDSFNVRTFARLMFATNSLPNSPDLSDGYFRKLLIVDFLNKFGDGGLPRDPNLMDKLATEEELSGLLNKALEGLNRLERVGKFTSNKSLSAAISRYRQYVNPVESFIKDICRVDESLDCEKKEIHEAYERWCADNGNKRLGRNTFYKSLESALPTVKKYRPSSRAPEMYRGIGLASR